MNSISSDVVYARTDYVKLITTQATYPGCVRGMPDFSQGAGPNWWCGLKVTGFNAAMDATYGLLIFAGILSFVVWALAQSISGGNVAVMANPNTFRATATLMGLSCFFTLVAVCNFDGAGIEKAFCSCVPRPRAARLRRYARC